MAIEFRKQERGTKKPATERGEVKGELIGVRVQPALAAAIDKYRGDRTRQAAIREILERVLTL